MTSSPTTKTISTPSFDGSSSSSKYNVTITPPSPIHLGLPKDAVIPPDTTPNSRLQMLRKRFDYDYNNFINLKHSIHTSPSHAHPEDSILLEQEQLKIWTSRVLAYILSTHEDKAIQKYIIEKGNDSISDRLDHIQLRIRTLARPPSPLQSPLKQQQQGSRSSTTTTSKRKIRLRDEKQARDCLRRIVIKFYLQTYLGIEFPNTPPTTFTQASTFIAINKFHPQCAPHIQSFGRRTFPHFPADYVYATNDTIVDAFINLCQREMLDIINYMTFLLRRDANESNYDNSQFTDIVPSVLMDKIRIRLIKDPNYSFDPATNIEYIKASNTSKRIFKTIRSDNNSDVSSDADTDTEVEYNTDARVGDNDDEEEEDHPMLVIDE